MNDILQVQSRQKQIEQLAAQRELYSSSKKLFNVQFWGNVVVPFALSIILLINPAFAIYGALYGLVFLVFDLNLIVPKISTLKIKAARIQELFDCEVLQIKENPLKFASDVTVEEVLVHYNVHKQNIKNVEKLRNWYPQQIGKLKNIAIARIVCQRANCWWDHKLGTKYTNLLNLIMIVVPTSVVIAGLFLKVSTEEILLTLSTLIPFYIFFYRELTENKNANATLAGIHLFIHNVIERINNKIIGNEELDATSRIIQDEIYDSRTKRPLIPDYIYKWFRTGDEKIMEETTETLVANIHRNNADK